MSHEDQYVEHIERANQRLTGSRRCNCGCHDRNAIPSDTVCNRCDGTGTIVSKPAGVVRQEAPYLKRTTVTEVWNPAYQQDRQCECEHVYYRHFDSYDDNLPVGCKYCDCMKFKMKC